MQPGIFLILFVIHLVHAAFNQANNPNTTWDGNSVKPKPNEATFCYKPAPNQTNATSCLGGHSEDTSFGPVLNFHLNLSQGWSIAYYTANSTLLGNQTYPVIANTGTLQCLSGQADDGTYQTMCMGIDYNNNIVEPGSYCQVKLGQTYVSDGCYTAMSNTTTSTATTSTAVASTAVASTAAASTTTGSQPASASSTSTNSSSTSPNMNLITPIATIVGALIGLLGTWTTAYCANAWCREQTKLCFCCISGRRE